MAGSHHNDPHIVDLLTQASVAAISWLQFIGVVFDHDAQGSLLLGREGGHDRPRIAHAGGDATGAVVMAALVAAARASTHIERRADVDIDALLLRDGRVCGVGMRHGDGSRSMLEGGAVVLATGGIGGLFAHTSNPANAKGSGLALALNAGARLRDLEFMQFHPTALALPGQHSLPLITEALRGAGAQLRDSKGRALMTPQVHPMADLAPRDIVARTVWKACQTGGAVLDAYRIGNDWSKQFPTVFRACMDHGIDPRVQPIPVVPVAHFHMGGVATDAECATSLPGLYAVGEVACNGVHGANRLASNSLLEGVVFGRRLGARLRAGTGNDGSKRPLTWVQRAESLGDAQRVQLRTLMMEAMGPLRSGAGLSAALADCETLAAIGWEGQLAQALLAAALQRQHSLGAHFRADEPELAMHQ